MPRGKTPYLGLSRPVAGRSSISARLVIAWLITGLGILGSLMAIAMEFHLMVELLNTMIVALAVSSVIVVLVLRYSLELAWNSAPFAYLYYFLLAHVPFLILWLIAANIVMDGFQPSQLLWLYERGSSTAALAVVGSLYSLLAGILVAHRWFRSPRSATLRDRRTLPGEGCPAVFVGGLVISIVAVGLYLEAVRRSGGLGMVLAPYSVYRQEVIGDEYIFAQFFIGLGGGIALAGAPRRHWYLGLIPFFILGSFYLVGGNRSGVLYPLLAYMVILGIKGIQLRKVTVWTIVIVILVTIGFVREARHEVADGVSSIAQVGWADPFLEMGFQIRTIAITERFIASGRLNYVKGGSYLLPVERQLARIVPWIERSDVHRDPRNTKSFTPSKGYSPVAEAYYNFGVWGPFIVFPILGFMLYWLNAFAVLSHYRLAAIAVLLFPLIDNVRNSFISVPGRVLGGFVLLGLIWIVDQVVFRRLKKRR